MSQRKKLSKLPEEYPEPKFTSKTLVESKFYRRTIDELSEKNIRSELIVMSELEKKLKILEKERNKGAVTLGLGALFMGLDSYLIKETIANIHQYPELFKIVGEIMFLECYLFAVCLVGMLYGADKLYQSHKEYKKCKSLLDTYLKKD